MTADDKTPTTPKDAQTIAESNQRDDRFKSISDTLKRMLDKLPEGAAAFVIVMDVDSQHVQGDSLGIRELSDEDYDYMRGGMDYLLRHLRKDK